VQEMVQHESNRLGGRVSQGTVLRAMARYRRSGIPALKNNVRTTPPIPKGHLPEDEDFLIETVMQSPRSLSLELLNRILPKLSEYIPNT
jgi:hypothetical protein